MIDALNHNSGELLTFLCIAGLVALAFRWRRAVRKGFLAAFGLVLLGLAVREGVVYWYGLHNWPAEAFAITAGARLAKVAGAVLFVRAATIDICGEWGWILVLAAASLAAWIV